MIASVARHAMGQQQRPWTVDRFARHNLALAGVLTALSGLSFGRAGLLFVPRGPLVSSSVGGAELAALLALLFVCGGLARESRAGRVVGYVAVTAWFLVGVVGTTA